MSGEGGVLGRRFRDRVTGFEGVATARTEYLDDPTASIRLTRADSDGKPDDVWITTSRLEPVDDKTSLGFGDRP